ncbi:hypothetical protein [Nonomuraea insulae]|uniref:Uncharacterized protein n=1 Tax=Nonomuraea insulae TaxID=1616787 RepID=A0ABW1CYU9_9ACTN
MSDQVTTTTAQGARVAVAGHAHPVSVTLDRGRPRVVGGLSRAEP